jgi:hypothetical protein
MLCKFQSVDALIKEVTETTGFLSMLISRKSGLALMFILLGVIASKLLFG